MAKKKHQDKKQDKKQDTKGSRKAGKGGKGGAVAVTKGSLSKKDKKLAAKAETDPIIVAVTTEVEGKAAEKAAKARKAGKDEGDGRTKGLPRFSDVLRVGPEVRLGEIDPSSTPGFDGDKADAEKLVTGLQDELADLQERLYAESKEGGQRRVLLVIQGMDTSGKGGIMRKVVGAFDPQGVHITSFKAPTDEERRHPFLWRIRRALPGPGMIGVFDRSHYEDVLIVRVHDLVPRQQWARRYAMINSFERSVSADHTTIIKVMLHISKDEQKARLAERLARPDKHWKFNPGDIDERMHWADYQEAYQVALQKCSTEVAPWYVVPADRKWYSQLAVTQLVLEHLRALDPQWPAADFDVIEQQARLADS